MPRIDADRNLLFGINALQNDFITRDDLIAAMHAWVMAKHRPIGEILVERGVLGPADRDAIEAMIGRRLAKHRDDPAAGLAALSSAGGLVEELRRSIRDPDLLASIAHVPGNAGPDPYATRATIPPQPPPSGVRFRKVREHASGNLGVVWVARDEELNREVALKEIKEKNADHPHSQAKFVLEAEVTGGLEHPGIVPVYGLGHHDDGRPFYAMRFIRGRSLLEAIKQFHADDSLKSDPGSRVLELQKLLRRFTDVCNAVAYAHSRGVLHRDLKPDNVMVGKYGETLVVDWGLAKALGRSGEPGATRDDPEDPLPEASLQPSSADGLEATQAGSFVGTPAYASPEQAAGRLDLLGNASDIYGLGATLYHLLAGRPPVDAANFGELLAKIQAGDVVRPRAIVPWLDPALEATCLKAMARKPEARYASARALAEDLDRWIAGEPVDAYPEPWTRRARRWAKKHRTSLATTATALIVAAILVGGVAWRQIDRHRTAEVSASLMLTQADRFAEAAHATGDMTLWAKAVAEARRALDLLESDGGDALRREAKARLDSIRVKEAERQSDLRMIANLEDAQYQQVFENGESVVWELKHAAYLAAFQVYGIDLERLTVEDAATRIRERQIADDLISALDDWAGNRSAIVPGDRLEAIARAADTDPDTVRIREAVSRGDAIGLRRLCETEEARRKLGKRIRNVSQALLRLDPKGSLPLLETFRRENPANVGIHNDLAKVYLTEKPMRPQEAVRCFSAALACRPDNSSLHSNLGSGLYAMRRFDEAVAEFRDAIRLKPENPEPYSNLGAALANQKQLDEAIMVTREAIRLRPKYADAHSNLGTYLHNRGKFDEAIAEFRDAIRLKPGSTNAHVNLGNLLRDRGKFDEALAEYHQAIRLKPDHSNAFSNLGVCLLSQHKFDEAIAAIREAIRIEPDDPLAYSNLGASLRARGSLDEAISACCLSIRLKPDYSGSHLNLGSCRLDRGEFDQAAAEFREAIRLDPDLATAHTNLGAALHSLKMVGEAIAEHRKSIQLKPDLADAHYNLGLALTTSGELAGAMAEYREAIRLQTEYPKALSNLGSLLNARGEIGAAIAEYREAIRLNPDLFEAHFNLGVVLGDRGMLDQGILEYREVIRLKPDLFAAHFNLGNALKARGDLDAATIAYREAIRLKPDFATAHCNLAAVLILKREYDGVIAASREAIRLDPEMAEAHANLAMALGALGRSAEAATEFRESVRLKLRPRKPAKPGPP